MAERRPQTPGKNGEMLEIAESEQGELPQQFVLCNQDVSEKIFFNAFGYATKAPGSKTKAGRMPHTAKHV